jgi:Protein of unknown function (DUF2911)
MRKIIAVSGLMMACMLAVAIASAAQQDKSKRASPPEETKCMLMGGQTINVNYSSPRMKGREIFGGLVPYGEVWRLGANEATTFTTSAELMVGDKEVPAGHYTLFAIPEHDKWTLIISKKTGEWGIPYPGEGSDFARTEMQVGTLPSPVEDFTIRLTPKGNGATMEFEWATTSASVYIGPKK